MLGGRGSKATLPISVFESTKPAAARVCRLKIVEIGKYFPPQYFGGIEVMTELSARALAGEHDLTVICHDVGARQEVEARAGYRVVRCGTQLKCFSQPISLLMGFELRKARPDLIHYHAPNLWSALMIVLFCPRTPVIVTHHADIEGRRLLKRIVMPLYHHLLKRTKSILVNSKKNVRVSTDLPRDIPRVAAVPHGIDERLYVLNEQDRSETGREKQAR